MQELVLSSAEQGVLDEASAEVMRHERTLRSLEEHAEKSRLAIVEAGGRLRGSVTTILTMRGLDPDDFVATWSNAEGRVVINKAEKK